MPNEVHTSSEPVLTGLLGGIVKDIGDLIRQEVRFAKAEVKADLGKTRDAVTLLSIGIVVASLSGLLFAWMLVHLLHWFTTPADALRDAGATLPLWACFGIVGALFLVVGGLMILAGVKKFRSFNPLPDETAKSIKENVQWIASSK